MCYAICSQAEMQTAVYVNAVIDTARMKVLLVKGKKWRGLYGERSTMQRQGKGNFPISFLHSWRNGNWHACICFRENTISQAARREARAI